MKKYLVILLSVVLVLSLISCKEESSALTIRVGATPVPHAELLELVKDELKEEGIVLEIVEFTDYVTPNIALSDGDIDANFFQHLPYLNEFSAEHNLELSSIGTIHVEPLGLYSNDLKSIDELKDQAIIAIPSDSVNGGRALILLENKGLITLKEGAGLKATEVDIINNPKQLIFKAVEAAQLSRILPDVDAAMINGNYAIEAGLSPVSDALIIEGSESPYANIVVVRTGEEESKSLVALIKALQSEKVKAFINAEYGGGVVDAFGE